MSTELKKCPFCGREVKWDCGSIQCKPCGLRFRKCSSTIMNEEAWNTRKLIDEIVERLEEKATEADEGYSIYEDTYIGGEGNAFRKAIEIVKGGAE